MNGENGNSPLKRNMKVYYGKYNYSKKLLLPMIRLHANYLLRYGFNVGDAIEVSVDRGEIKIKKVESLPP